MAKLKPDPLDVLRANRAFACLPTPDIERLATFGVVEHYRDRTLLAGRGETPARLWFVASGAIDLTLTTRDGAIARLPITPGYWATWAGCFGSTPLLFDFYTSRMTTLVSFPRAEVLAATKACPEALLHVIDLLSENVAVFTAWILSTTIFTAEQRLAYVLLVLSTRFRAAGASEASITREQLGMLGLGTRQRVSRLLNGLVRRGLVRVRDGKISILSGEKLAEFSG